MKKILAALLCAVFLAGCSNVSSPSPAPTPSQLPSGSVSQPTESASASATPDQPVKQPRGAEQKDPARVIAVPLSAPKLTFDTTDLQDNPVDAGIFEGFEITMVNIWATWCGPCVSEMPEIAKAYTMLPENANIITICTDAGASEDTLLDAVTILSDSSATELQTLYMDDSIEEFLQDNVSAFPTTVFVNSKGQVVGDFQVGVPMDNPDDVAQSYINLINERLSK